MKHLIYLSLIITVLFSCTKVTVQPSQYEPHYFDNIIPIGLPKSVPDSLYPYQLGYFVSLVSDNQVTVNISFGGGNHIAGKVFFQTIDIMDSVRNDSLNIPADEKFLSDSFQMDNNVKSISVTNIKY